jgi:hypothetical protein
MHFPELSPGGDVSDWTAVGHNIDELWDRIDATPPWSPPIASSSIRPTAAGSDLIARRASEIAPNFVCVAPGGPSCPHAWKRGLPLGPGGVQMGNETGAVLACSGVAAM